MILLASLRSSRGQPPMMSIASSKESGSRSAAMSLHGGDQETVLELAAAVEVEHRASPPPAAGRHPGTREGRPQVLLAVVEVLDRDPPQLALEDGEPALLLGAHGQYPPLDPDPATTSPTNRTDHDRTAAVDVAVQ
jgi:hypothetical protein